MKRLWNMLVREPYVKLENRILRWAVREMRYKNFLCPRCMGPMEERFERLTHECEICGYGLTREYIYRAAGSLLRTLRLWTLTTTSERPTDALAAPPRGRGGVAWLGQNAPERVVQPGNYVKLDVLTTPNLVGALCGTPEREDRIIRMGDEARYFHSGFQEHPQGQTREQVKAAVDKAVILSQLDYLAEKYNWGSDITGQWGIDRG